MSKYALTFALALVLAAGGYGAWMHHIASQRLQQVEQLQSDLRTAGVALRASQEASRRATNAALSRARRAEKAAIIQKESNDTLQQALRADQAWADQPLPAGVAEWLRNGPSGDPDSAGKAPGAPAP